LYQNLNQNCNILFSEYLFYALYVCTCVFFLYQESFNMILVNNSSFYDGGVTAVAPEATSEGVPVMELVGTLMQLSREAAA
jgi:uncharacterized membrane-anchored protein YitT (DUF2179 family)